jgi:hypothetical protein
MRFHDYHLTGYEVANRGQTVKLNLEYDYPDQEKHRSFIQFHEVALYSFIHTDGAIILDIEQVSVAELVMANSAVISEWSRKYSVRFWQGDLEEYSATLVNGGYQAWIIESAIGFYGFVIAKSVSNQ